MGSIQMPLYAIATTRPGAMKTSLGTITVQGAKRRLKNTEGIDSFRGIRNEIERDLGAARIERVTIDWETCSLRHVYAVIGNNDGLARRGPVPPRSGAWPIDQIANGESIRRDRGQDSAQILSPAAGQSVGGALHHIALAVEQRHGVVGPAGRNDVIAPQRSRETAIGTLEVDRPNTGQHRGSSDLGKVGTVATQRNAKFARVRGRS